MATEASALVSTKLLKPLARATLVPRPRLAERLAGGLVGSLVLVSAPAGFGKTSLLAQWLSGVERADPNLAVAWLALDEGDNDPNRFWTYFLAACRQLGPDLGEGARALLGAAQQSPRAPMLAALINDFADRARREPAQRYLLVLDDYHTIVASAIHAEVAFLLDRLPPNLHLVVATRSDPPLPLARLRARGQVVEVRATDLRFTLAEAEDFLAQATGQPLRRDDVEALSARTEGWAAGLQLAALSLQGVEDVAGFVRDFTGTNRYVFDYLAEEVLERLSAADRAFLLLTSILDSLSGPLCDAVTGASDGHATLRRLEQANLFIVPLDQARLWYRYHHLFAYFLRAQLEQERGAETVARLHGRASEWYERQQQLGSAVEHALAGRNWTEAVRLVEAAVTDAFRRHELHTLIRWVRQLPWPALGERPSLVVGYAWALLATSQVADIDACLAAVERHFGLAGISLGDAAAAALAPAAQGALVEATVLRSSLAVNAFDLPQVLRQTKAVLQALSPNPPPLPYSQPEHILPVAFFNRALAHEFSGQAEAAGRYFAEAAKASAEGRNPDIAHLATSHLARMQQLQGRLAQAMDTYTRALSLATGEASTPSPLAAIAHAGLAALCYERDELDLALNHAREAITLGEEWNNAESLLPASTYLALLRRAQGDHEGAQATVSELVRSRSLHDQEINQRLARALGARLALDRGDLPAAAAWAQAVNLDVTGELPYFLVGEYVILAKVLMAQGQGLKALDLLARLLAAAEAGGRHGDAVGLLVLTALAWDGLGNAARAQAALKRALALGSAEGYARAFLDEVPRLLPMLAEAARRGEHSDYARRLLGLAGGGKPSRAPRPETSAGDGPEPLTERETEVLRLLAQGLTNQEIADRLVLSVGTVKTHTHNIYAKLGAASRGAALARARGLGLL